VLSAKGAKLKPGRSAPKLLRDPVALCRALAEAMCTKLGPTQHRWQDDPYGWGWFADELDASLANLLQELYRNDEPDDIEDMSERFWQHLMRTFRFTPDPDRAAEERRMEFQRRNFDHQLRVALAWLGRAGLVEVRDVVDVPTTFGSDQSGGVVALTDLGAWWVHERAVAAGMDAPVVGALAELDAAELLSRVADLGSDTAAGELDVWLQRRGSDGPGELCDVLAQVGETERVLAFKALLRFGPAASPAVEALAVDPNLAPWVTVWRVDTLQAMPDEMSRAGDPAGYVALVHAAMEMWGPVAAVSAWALPAAGDLGVEAMLAAVWRVPGPRTDVVLAAIGQHPDKHVAKLARTALHKHRSLGG
jgi:hypothetical protein